MADPQKSSLRAAHEYQLKHFYFRINVFFNNKEMRRGLLWLFFLFSVTSLRCQDMDWHYGTEMRFINHSEVSGVRTVWLSEIKELDGVYEGKGSHSGDRRFGSYERLYRIRIRARDSGQTVSPVDVDWWSKTEKWSGHDGSTADLVKFCVKNANSNGSQIWGSMVASVDGKDQGAQFPFWAMPAEREDGTKGILLFGRYEGPVFLKKK